MSRIARFAVLVAALSSLFAVMSSTAGAVTWHNTGSSALHATGVGGTLSTPGGVISCTASTATGTAPVGTFSPNYSVSGTVTFTPCFVAGQQTYVHCGFTLTAQSQPVAGQTVGSADVTCDVRLHSTSTKLCHIEGSTPGSYFNPVGATPGRVTLNTSAGGLNVTNAGGTPCPLGTGIGHLSEQTLTLTSGGPIITRTA